MKFKCSVFIVFFIFAFLFINPNNASEDTTTTTESNIKLTKNQANAPAGNRFSGLGNLFGQLFPGGSNNGNVPQFGQNNNQNNFSPGLNQAPSGQNNNGWNPNFQNNQASLPNQGQFGRGGANQGQLLNAGQNQNIIPGQWQNPNQGIGNVQNGGSRPNQGGFIQNPSSQWQNPNQGISNPTDTQNINFPGQWPSQTQQNQGAPISGDWMNPQQNQNQGATINPNQWQNQVQNQNQNQGAILNPDQWQNQAQNQNNPSLWQNPGANQNQMVPGQWANQGQGQNAMNPAQWQNQGVNPGQNFPDSGQWQNQATAQDPNQWLNQGNQNTAGVNNSDRSPQGSLQVPSGDQTSTGNGNINSGTNSAGSGNQTSNQTGSSTIPDQAQCVLNCPVTNEYNPICGSNNISYSNPASFQCARRCGVNVEIFRRGRCPNDSPFRNGL